MAGSIKFLSFGRKYCHFVGMYPLEPIQNGPLINSRNWIFIISYVLLFLPSAAFLVFEAKSMLEYGFSFFAASSGIHGLCIYLAIIWQSKSILPFIENCERFIEKRDDSTNTYRELIEKIEQLCKIVCIALFVTILIFTLPFLINSFINYYLLDLGAESFRLFYPVTWPFDWKTPLGYFVAWFIQTAGFVVGSLTAMMIQIHFVCPCWLFIVMAKDFTKDMAAFNTDVQANKNPVELKKRLCDIIQIYSDAKECITEFNAIIKYSIFFNISLLMLSVTSLLLTLQFQLTDDNAKLIETFTICITGFWIFGTLFFYCEIGQRVTYHFDNFRKEVERCDWHTLPIEMQRMYLLFLADTQQPKNIECFGNIILSRETFKRILNTAYSYFNTIRQLDI